MLPAALETAQLVVGGIAMREPVEREEHPRVAPGHGEVPHVGLGYLDLEPPVTRLHAQPLQHGRFAIQPVGIDAALESREQHPPGPARHVEHRTATAARLVEPELQILIIALEHQIVEIGSLVYRGQRCPRIRHARLPPRPFQNR